MDLSNLKARAKSQKKAFKKLYRKAERLKDKELDFLFHEAHNHAFSCIDCLACANCCKTTGPLFTNRDIQRISAHLNIKEAQFVDDYLKMDEDEDYVLKSTPCHFLDPQTNRCSIYDVRPKACAQYPHTDMNAQKKLQSIAIKNSAICPAVFEVLSEVEQKLNA